MTPMYFLNLYLQLAYTSKVKQDLNFLFPRYNATMYSRVAHLLNLSTLDVHCVRFSYSVLAAAALYIAANPSLATAVSGESECCDVCIELLAGEERDRVFLWIIALRLLLSSCSLVCLSIHVCDG